VGDGAGVDDEGVGRGRAVDDLDAGAGKVTGDALRVGLVELAAERDDGDAPRRVARWPIDQLEGRGGSADRGAPLAQ
jgi:hypothetical protein